jgi:ubiquinone/menaquinone biosynthesis C-methylase UbiE
MSTLKDALEKFPQEEGIYAISKSRFFQHPEEAYDAQYGHDTLDLQYHLREGNALLDLCEEFGYDRANPALEIGCGTGRVTLSLVLSGRLGDFLITDPSPAFCRIAASKLGKLTPPFNAKLAVLLAEEINRLPKNLFSLIVLRSTLHHILNVRQFFSDCAGILAPGGLILFEEPCYEGYVLMGAITQCMPEILKANRVRLNKKHLSDIQIFAEAMRFYARRDVDKSTAEDKHLFRVDELMRICLDYGMRLEHFPNRVFGNIDRRNEPLESEYFERFYSDYMTYALAFDTDLVKTVMRYGKKYLEYFSPLSAAGAAPYTYGTFLCKKM